MHDSMDAPAHRRFHFSLRTALAAIALIAVCLTLFISWRQSRENQLLRQENARLRAETGQLQIEPGTENKVQAVGISTAEGLTWKWRVYVPNRQNIRISLICGAKIPAHSIPTEVGGGTLNPGEHLITVALHRNVHDKWEWHLNSETTQVSIGSGDFISDEEAKPLIDPHYGNTESVTNKAATLVEPGQPLILLRYRAFPAQPTRQQESNPANGVMVWIHEEPADH
jgi:hypothetical protein